MSQGLIFFLVCSDFVHECVLAVDQFKPFLEAGIVISVNLLLEADFEDASECLSLGFVVRVGVDLIDGLKGTYLCDIVVFVLRLLGDFAVDELELLFRMSVELPLLDLLGEVSSENSVNDAQGGLLVCG